MLSDLKKRLKRRPTKRARFGGREASDDTKCRAESRERSERSEGVRVVVGGANGYLGENTTSVRSAARDARGSQAECGAHLRQPERRAVLNATRCGEVASEERASVTPLA